MSFLNHFAPRERALILIAAALMCLFILWQFMLAPALGASKAAKAELAKAQRDASIVHNALPALQSKQSAPKALFDRSAAITAARNANVSVSRVQPGANKALQIWLDDSPAQSVYAFLSELSRLYDVNTQQAKMVRQDNGLISAQFTFAPAV